MPKQKTNVKAKTTRRRTLAPTARRARADPPPPAPRRGMVIVHGGGDIAPDYYLGLVQGVQAQLGKPFEFIAAYYSDVITEHMPGIAATVDSPAVEKFKAEYEKQLRETHTRNRQDHPGSAGATGFLGIDAALGDTVNEVVRYIFDGDAAAQVQIRLKKAFDQAMQDYDEIVLVTHSLGTVATYDVLRQFAAQYKIAIWFTLGCPLGKLVKLRFRPASLGAIALPNVARWHNVYDTNDFVADVIGAYFHASDFRVHDIFVEVANAMPDAHDYFKNPETQALLADALR